MKGLRGGVNDHKHLLCDLCMKVRIFTYPISPAKKIGNPFRHVPQARRPGNAQHLEGQTNDLGIQVHKYYPLWDLTYVINTYFCYLHPFNEQSRCWIPVLCACLDIPTSECGSTSGKS